MSVASYLAAGNTQIEFILCVEGIGWPTDEFTLASGFDGDVFVSSDFNGTLATDLGCTIHKTLNTPSGISDSINPITAKYQTGGMNFGLIDDGFLVTAFAPLRSGYETALTSAITYDQTTIRLDDGTNYATGSVAWINGSELVLLGTKANFAGTIYDYSSSTRGYLGTRRGPKFSRVQTTAGMQWEVGATVYSHDRYLHGRRVLLFLHVPGETVGNCLRVYGGTLQSIDVENSAGLWNLETTSLDVSSYAQDIVTPKGWYVSRDDFGLTQNTRNGTVGATDANGYAVSTIEGYGVFYRNLEIGFNYSAFSFGDPIPQTSRHAMNAAYNYRWEVGGTVGMLAGTALTVQALDDTDISTYCITEDGYIVKLEERGDSYTPSGVSVHFVYSVRASIDASEAAQDSRRSLTDTQIQFLLSNITDDYKRNRFAFNRRGWTSASVSRNPVDVALMFMLSMSDEFSIEDCSGASTSTVIVFPNTVVPTDDFYNGYALFCVEGDYKYQARVISDCSTGGTDTVTVEKAFGGAPPNGTEFQIRNSIYDVLPFGWGLGIHNKYVDIESFENVRSQLLSGADLSPFMIGYGDKIEMWKMIVDAILAPYNIMVYINQTTGKITAKYVGEALGDGILPDEIYLDLDTSNIIDVGKYSYQLNKPVSTINCKVRSSNQVVVYRNIRGMHEMESYTPYGAQTIANPLVGGAAASLQYRSDEIYAAYGEKSAATFNFDLPFHTILDGGQLEPYMVGKLKRSAIPPPAINLTLDLSLIVSLRAGSYVNLVIADWPVDIFDTSRGISQVGLVTESNVNFESSSMEVSVQLLPALEFGLIAPAAIVTAKGNDAGGDYVVVTDDAFGQWATNSAAGDMYNKDWWFFAVGQQLTLRDVYGVDQEDLGEIIGFGTTVVSDPTQATSSRIYFSAGIARVIGSGDYVTLYRNWTATEHDNYSPYGDATVNAIVDGGSTSAKRYV